MTVLWAGKWDPKRVAGGYIAGKREQRMWGTVLGVTRYRLRGPLTFLLLHDSLENRIAKGSSLLLALES